MKQLWLKSMLLLIPFFSKAESEKSIRNSRVTDVKIFLSGAQVTRKIATPVEAGITKLSVEDLSPGINASNITVSGSGDLTILSVKYQLSYLNSGKKTPEIIKLEDSLELLNNKIEVITNEQSVYQEEESMILANKTIGGANTGVKTEDVIRMADFYRSRLVDIKSRLMELNRREKKLREEADKLNKQLTSLNAKKNQPTGTVVITVSANTTTTANLKLTYSVNNAGWTPFYDLRAENSSSPIKVVYRANVFQSSGEEWDGINLILSTGNPDLSGNKPELSAWYLNFFQRYYSGNALRKAELSQQLAGSVPSMRDDKDESAFKEKADRLTVTANSTADFTRIAENQINAEFVITLPYTVPSDGKQRNVEIQEYTVQAGYNYAAVPKLEKDVFLNSNITGWENLNLLPGKANIYFEGGYVGETILDPNSFEDTLKVSLGREKRIIVKREKLKDLTGGQFLGSNNVKQVTFEITVKNTKKEKIMLDLEDQVPVSRQKDIEVNVTDLGGAEISNETGKLTWHIDMEPNQTIKKKFSFTVKYPKGEMISGI